MCSLCHLISCYAMPNMTEAMKGVCFHWHWLIVTHNLSVLFTHLTAIHLSNATAEVRRQINLPTEITPLVFIHSALVSGAFTSPHLSVGVLSLQHICYFINFLGSTAGAKTHMCVGGEEITTLSSRGSKVGVWERNKEGKGIMVVRFTEATASGQQGAHLWEVWCYNMSPTEQNSSIFFNTKNIIKYQRFTHSRLDLNMHTSVWSLCMRSPFHPRNICLCNVDRLCVTAEVEQEWFW